MATKSEKKYNIYEKLWLIQQNLEVPKTQYNKFGNFYYRSCEDILSALKPLLIEYKVAITITDNIVEIGGKNYVKATVTLYDLDNIDGEPEQRMIQVSAFAREDEAKKGMDLSQITGSTSSYARKYALNGLFAIDDNKDSDFLNTGKDEDKENKNDNEQSESKALTDNQIKRLFALGYAAGYDSNSLKQQIKKQLGKEIKDLNLEEYEKLCKGLEQKSKQK